MRRYSLTITVVLLILVASIALFSYGVIVGKEQLFPYKHVKQAYDWSRSQEVFQWLRKVQVELNHAGNSWSVLRSALYNSSNKPTGGADRDPGGAVPAGEGCCQALSHRPLFISVVNEGSGLI